MLIIKSKDLSDRSFPIGLKCKSAEQAKTWLANLTRIPGAEEEEKASAEEQSLIEQDDLFISSASAEEASVKSASKVDENNNLAKKAAAAAEALLQQVKDSETSGKSDVSTSSTLESSIASLESATKSSAGNANADVMEDNTEATTAPTDNLRTDSLSSVDGKCSLRICTTFYPIC